MSGSQKESDKKKYNGYRASVEYAREFFEDLFNSY